MFINCFFFSSYFEWNGFFLFFTVLSVNAIFPILRNCLVPVVYCENLTCFFKILSNLTNRDLWQLVPFNLLLVPLVPLTELVESCQRSLPAKNDYQNWDPTCSSTSVAIIPLKGEETYIIKAECLSLSPNVIWILNFLKSKFNLLVLKVHCNWNF